MSRPQAKKTNYVSTLSDGQTNRYWLMFLVTAFHGRAILCGFGSYSSRAKGFINGASGGVDTFAVRILNRSAMKLRLCVVRGIGSGVCDWGRPSH